MGTFEKMKGVDVNQGVQNKSKRFSIFLVVSCDFDLKL